MLCLVSNYDLVWLALLAIRMIRSCFRASVVIYYWFPHVCLEGPVFVVRTLASQRVFALQVNARNLLFSHMLCSVSVPATLMFAGLVMTPGRESS